MSPMPQSPQFPIRIFYDGSCSVCAREINHYLQRDHGGKLLGVDISAHDFDPEPYRIPLDLFMYELHVIDQKGETYKGVAAFWAIWQAFPARTIYGLLGTIITLPVVNPMARLAYKGFAAIRPFLPKRHSCDSGTCQIGKH